MDRKLGRLIAAALLLSSAAQAEQRLDLKGIDGGSTEAEFLARFPDSRCEEKAAGKRSCMTITDFSFGGATGKGAAAVFVGESLMMMVVYLDEKDFTKIIDALSAKYGAASTDKTEAIQNRMGATFDNRNVIWSREGERIMAIQRAGSIERSAITLQIESASDQASKAREEEAKKDAEDL